MLHELVKIWFGWVDSWGYLGIFVLMAMESTIIPVPSEIVIPPAAFWAAQGRMSVAGVVLAGAVGSYVGSVINYWVSQWIGLPVLRRYGHLVLIKPDKIAMGEQWIGEFGVPGVFAARLLPVIRHLISIPAGILKMPFAKFSAATILGAGLWCGVLAWFGERVIGDHPELLQSPEAMAAVIRAKLIWFVSAVIILAGLYSLVAIFQYKNRSPRPTVADRGL